jgi:hypothetical protein
MNGKAADLLEVDAVEGFAYFPYDPAWFYGLAIYADVCAALHEREPARTLYDRLAPWHRQVSLLPLAVNGGAAAHISACWPRSSNASMTPRPISPRRWRSTSVYGAVLDRPHAARMGPHVAPPPGAGRRRAGWGLLGQALTTARP